MAFEVKSLRNGIIYCSSVKMLGFGFPFHVVIAIQWSLLIAFETTLFCDNVVSKCWLVIGSITVMTTRTRSNVKTFLYKTAGKIFVFAQ